MTNEVNSYLEKLQKVSSVMEQLIESAMSDNHISEEEKELLFGINKNIEQYAKITIEAISDGNVSNLESEAIRSMQETIIADAQQMASKDEKRIDIPAAEVPAEASSSCC